MGEHDPTTAAHLALSTRVGHKSLVGLCPYAISAGDLAVDPSMTRPLDPSIAQRLQSGMAKLVNGEALQCSNGATVQAASLIGKAVLLHALGAFLMRLVGLE